MKVIVADKGLFFFVAERLARDMEVLYFLQEEDPAPHRQSDEIGTGFENIKVIDNLWRNLDKKIPVVFTDVYNGGLPEYLHKEGFPVVSSLRSENIEVNRRVLKNVLKTAGLPVAPHTYSMGLTNAQEYLKDKEDKWLKSLYRGDWETYHYCNAFLSSQWFDRKRAEMGAGAEDIEILIEDNVSSVCEVGFETPMLNGEIAPNCLVGYEWKDQAYIGKVVDKLPAIFQTVHDKMKPAFKTANYQGWYSNEVRITNKKVPYYGDATCRFGRPPSEGYCELYNFPETVWELAHGRMPVLKPVAPYVAQLILTSDEGEKDWLPIQYPKSIDQWVKLYSPKKTKEGYYHLPHVKDGYFGAVVGLGNTLKEAMKLCLDRAKMIKADGLEYHEMAFKNLIHEAEVGKQYGVQI